MNVIIFPKSAAITAFSFLKQIVNTHHVFIKPSCPHEQQRYSQTPSYRVLHKFQLLNSFFFSISQIVKKAVCIMCALLRKIELYLIFKQP